MARVSEYDMLDLDLFGLDVEVGVDGHIFVDGVDALLAEPEVFILEDDGRVGPE